MLEFFQQYDLEQRLNADYRRHWASVVIALNNFKIAGALSERGVPDTDLFFGYLAPQLVRADAFWRELHALRGQRTPTYGLSNFAEAAQGFINARETSLQ